MRSSYLALLAAACIYACNNKDDGDQTKSPSGKGGTSAGAAGESEMAAGATAKGGTAGTSNSSDAGASGASIDAGGAAGVAGTIGNGGANTSAGAGGESETSLAGAAGAAQVAAAAEWLDDLPGPETDDIVILDASYVHDKSQLFGLYVTDDDQTIAGVWQLFSGNPTQTLGALIGVGSDYSVEWSVNVEYPDPTTTPAYGWTTVSLAGGGGNVFVGGRFHASGVAAMLPGETARGGDDWAIGAYGTTGTKQWLHQLGSAQDDAIASIFAGADGSVYLFGTIGGQLPGKAAELRGGPAVVKYDAEGNQVWATQYKNSPNMITSNDNATDLSMDAAGNIYTSDYYGLTRLDSDGEKQWYRLAPSYSRNNAAEAVLPNVVKIAARPSGGAVFSYGGCDTDIRQCPLQKFDANGNALWLREPGRRQETIDPVEGVIWNGSFVRTNAFLVTDDAVFITGQYSNSYTNGSTARPATTPGFVARYDLDGNQVWFKQFLVKSGSTNSNFIPEVIARRPNGDITFGGNGPGWILLTVSAEDGSLR